MIRHLLDTSMCIELIRGRSSLVLKRLRRREVGQVGISAITLAELQYGVAKSTDPARNKIALAEFCAPLEVVPFDDHVAAVYGQVRAKLEGAGEPVGPLDTLIAAHALAVHCVLVTCNEREFRRVTGLKVENWAKA